MVIAEKSKLVKRIFQLGATLDEARRELDHILDDVLATVPENDPRPDPRWINPGAVEEALPASEPVSPPPPPIDGGLPSTAGALDVQPGGSTGSPDVDAVQYETRTMADFETPFVPMDPDEAIPETD